MSEASDKYFLSINKKPNTHQTEFNLKLSITAITLHQYLYDEILEKNNPKFSIKDDGIYWEGIKVIVDDSTTEPIGLKHECNLVEV